jgi:ABC-type branched-subunit amino acid transport system substrate-binding protein
MTRSRALPAVLLLVLALPACGARLDAQTRKAAAAGSLQQVDAGSSGEGGATATGPSGGPLGTVPAVGGGTGAAAGAAAGPGGRTAPGGAAPVASGAAAPAGGNGGATDVGVTASTITLGNVADLSGPVPGLFQGAVIGTQAYLAKVNSEGGVFGRQLKLRVGDGQLDCDTNTAQTKALASKVFAFVGSFSIYDGCGAKVLAGMPGVPDIHNALAANAGKLPNNFSVTPLTLGWRTGPLLYYKQKYGEAFKHIGTIYADAGGGAATWKACEEAITKLGGHVDYERGFSPTDTDFNADILAMRRNGVQMIYVTASDAPTVARLFTAARQQQVDWPLLAGGVSYDEGFTARAGSAGEGSFSDQQFAPFFSKNAADLIPAVKDFQYWTNRVAPGEKRDLFGVFGWSSAQMFVQALEKAGPRATRADVLAQLRKVTSFDADGLIAPGNPAGKKPPNCWLLLTVRNGQWQRVSPAKGFRCDGPYYYAHG